MFLLWDALVVVIIAVFALSAYRKGFLNAVVRLLGTVGALALSLIYSAPIAQLIYGNYLEQRVAEAVAQNIDRFGEPGLEAFAEGMHALVEQLPPALAQAVSFESSGSLEQWYESVVSSGGATMTASLTDTIIGPIAVGLVQVVVFFVMFAACMLLVNALAGLLRGVNKIPLIGTVNALLGGVFGAVQGMLYVFVGAAILWLLLTASGDALPFLTNEMVEKTFLFKHFFLAGPWVDNALKLV